MLSKGQTLNAEQLAARIGTTKRRGEWWDAPCPAHQTSHDSLSFRDNHERGWVQLVCRAGCTPATICTQWGLSPRELSFRADAGRLGPSANGRLVARYAYHDETGELSYEVLRYEPKTFRQRRPDGRRGWTWNLDSVRRVLYRLPALRDQESVYLTEGEKDAEALAALGFPATTNPQGAGSWREEYAAQLVAAGVREVVILPDNDEPGEKHAATVAHSCIAVGLVVKVVHLPGLSAKGDVSDWLAQGHTAEELRAAAAMVPRWTVENEASGSPTAAGLALTPIADLLAEQEESCAWLVEGLLPAAGLSLIAGKPKAGKSTAARCLALAVARGEPWLGLPTRTGLVFYLGFEEKRGEVSSHFRCMGARPDDMLEVLIGQAPDDALHLLRASAERCRPALIIVDTVARLVRVNDWNDYAQVTRALEPVLALARETGAAVLLVHHAGKGERAGGDAILGSTAIFAAVDTALFLRRSDRYRTLCSQQRYGEDLEELTVMLDHETGWLSRGVAREEADDAEAADAIRDYLRGQLESAEEGTIPVVLTITRKRGIRDRPVRRWLRRRGELR